MISVRFAVPGLAGPRRAAGCLALVGASLLVLVFLAHHPVSAGAHDTRDMLEALAHLGGRAALVHALLIGLVSLLLFGVIDLADALATAAPQHRVGVVFGLALYGGGCAAVTGAMLLDGFVTAQLAARLLAQGAAGHDAAPLPDNLPALFALLGCTIQVLTKAGLCGMGGGMCALSCMAGRRDRWFAAAGPLAGLLPAIVTVYSGAHLQPHLLLVLAACQALWYLAAARSLWALRMR